MAIDQRIYGILAVAIAIVVFLVIFFIFKSILKVTIKIILIILFVAAAVFARKQGGEAIYKAWANGNWNDPSVPCFVLNEENCNKRAECKISPVNTPVGESAPICMNK